jgi:phosphoglycerate dehydrogenase-like enzyme
MKLIIKKMDNDGRLGLLNDYLSTSWDFRVADDEDERDFAGALADADAIISMDWGTAPPAPHLKLIHLPGAGTDGVDFSAVPARATVCNVFGHEISIAEYVLATMLETVIGLRRMDAALRRNNWFGSYLCGPRHQELHGKTLGIVGYGHIGREVARRASAFGMQVIACNRTPKAADAWTQSITGMHGFLLSALPLEDKTRGLVDAAVLAAMKPSAVIINVARGAIIDEAALWEACRDRRIGGAVIDTWYAYPPQGADHAVPSRFPFRDLDNVILTPHASGWTEDLKARRCAGIAENLDRLARGEPLIRVVKAASTHQR